jgi:mRNA-degrading endonuclease RelE of RelBE toxin-antitoxin system
MWDRPCGEQDEGWLFIEFREFSTYRDDYFPSDGQFAGFQDHLARNPDEGDVMPGCGGLRKIRWPDQRRGKGRRGGLRIIYLLIPEVRVIVLVDVYDKGESEDLSANQERELTRLAKAIKDELISRHRK